MILTLKNNFIKIVLLVALIAIAPVLVSAQTSVSLSVTPTKFDVQAAETQTWSTELRVINSNSFPLTVFADAVNFAPRGDGGDGQFIPVLATENQGQTLAEWITLPAESITIPAEQTVSIPVTISVPIGAAPGGHYAAILVSTQPPAVAGQSSQVQTAQAVTSLVFMRVAGDIVEQGSIREFMSENRLASRPAMDFSLRFENLGNVHIQPQGEIIIKNMWGQERGIIPINQRSTFGDVLPEQIRRFTFSWQGEWSLADIGRYRAELTISYGREARQFDSRTITFWVIPWQWVLGVLFGVSIFIWLLVWGIRQYIRRMLLLSGIDPEISAKRGRLAQSRKAALSLTAPIEAGLLDLRNRLDTADSPKQRLVSYYAFLIDNRSIVAVTIAVILLVGTVWWYISAALTPARPYEVQILQGGEVTTISSEGSTQVPSVNPEANTFLVAPTVAPAIAVVNQSGVAGAAARVRVLLEQVGYQVAAVEAASEAIEARTFIVYGPRHKDVALDISRLLGNTLISAYAPADEDEVPITIYVGADRI